MIRPALVTDAEALAALWNPWIRDTAITFNPVEKTAAEIAAMIRDRQAAGHGVREINLVVLVPFIRRE